MQQKHLSWLVLGGMLCLATFVAVSGYHLSGLDQNITKLIQTYGRKVGMQTVTAIVETQSGQKHTVATTRNDGESAADWAARHQEAIDVIKALP